MSIHPLGPPAPRQPTNRFWLPLQVFGHRVFPLKLLSEDPEGHPERTSLGLEDNLPIEAIVDLDHSYHNIGMLCGTVSNTTVLAVTTERAQEWLDEQDIFTPSVWTRRARYYFFNYVPGEMIQIPLHEPCGCSIPRDELAILNDGEWIVYPGSMYEDGRLTYWETSPDEIEVADLPNQFLRAC